MAFVQMLVNLLMLDLAIVAISIEARVCQPTSATAAGDTHIPPFALPSGFPVPALASGSNDSAKLSVPVPTHFGLFGYSFDGNIWNQTFYASGQPYNTAAWGFVVRPEDAYKNQSFGSYAFGIGPQKYLFAMNDGRIATTGSDSTDANWVFFESWADWWGDTRTNEREDLIPTCQIVPFFNILTCQSDGKRLKFGWCEDGVEPGVGYTAETVVWGTRIEPCTEIIVHVKQVPKTYGNQFPEQACPAYPYISKCQK